jgi:hypothetical protein
MSETVWVSRALMAANSIIEELSSEGYLSETCKDPAVGFDHSYWGKTIPAECFPTMAFVVPYRKPIKTLPHFFSISGYWCVSEKSAAALSKFDLGGAEFIKVKITQEDKVTDLPGSYFFINFGRTKSAFVPEQTVGAKKGSPPRIDWRLPLTLEDGLVVVNQQALVGQDMWFDTYVCRAFFISSRLQDALKRAGVDKAFKLFRCKVVGG